MVRVKEHRRRGTEGVREHTRITRESITKMANSSDVPAFKIRRLYENGQISKADFEYIMKARWNRMKHAVPKRRERK